MAIYVELANTCIYLTKGLELTSKMDRDRQN